MCERGTIQKSVSSTSYRWGQILDKALMTEERSMKCEKRIEQCEEEFITNQEFLDKSSQRKASLKLRNSNDDTNTSTSR